ncbi:MAG: O-methyltransferase [Candidatus Lernaella stagnicola]|nr:O-methyltransferase [Candidatus Lernaella stagnicola]
MLPIVHPKLEQYLESVSAPRDAVLTEMEAIAAERDFPIIGPDVGRFLFAVTRFAGAKRVLELGSGYGYSAYWFALAMPAGGVVECIDTEPENRAHAEAFFQRAGLADKLRFHIGEALGVAEGLEGPYDIVFNDIDKEDYPASIAVARRLLRPGGLFVTDNALWHGKVVDEDFDPATAGVLAFNQALAESTDFETVVLPLRDGLSVAVKL